MFKPSILVVEDQIIEQKLLSLLAQKYGYDVQIVSSSEEALNEIETGKLFSIILMDWKLPGIDGLDCTKRIRELERNRGYHTPIVAITGRAMDGDKTKCLVAGMDDYMSKPFSAEEFRQMLNRWIPDSNSDILFH
ncbi:MAG: response regulator [Candidatus Obscuribacterales bacterium]|jgi:CheY-like chemotaxis protein|nr:response regulator [Candidatus Obscuribacterales bacterium]